MSAFYNPAIHGEVLEQCDDPAYIEQQLINNIPGYLEQQLAEQEEEKMKDPSYIAYLTRDLYPEMNFPSYNTYRKKDRKTHCWNCKDLRLNSATHTVCKKCGWIKCPTCGRCSPSCSGH